MPAYPDLDVSPIFQSVGQCLHVAYLIETLPASAKSVMQSMIERAMEEAGIAIVRERGTVNFGGLSALEIRGQCAMIRGAVLHQLPAPEADAIHARYAHRTIKAAGVRGARDYSQPLLSTHGDMPTLAMAWSIYGTVKQREGLTTRMIAAEFGLSQSTVARDTSTIKRTTRMLENRATDRLTAVFEKSGLIPLPE